MMVMIIILREIVRIIILITIKLIISEMVIVSHSSLYLKCGL